MNEEQSFISVGGRRLAVYTIGAGPRTLLLLNGGPGLPNLYLRAPHRRLAAAGIRVIGYDQLGCGASDRPDDLSLWTVGRYADELEAVLDALSIDAAHVLGHSWGTFLAIETALRIPERFKSIILADGAADIPHLVDELNRLRSALGSETVAMMQRHEAEGTLDHPTYQAAITILNHRHVCRLDHWPEPLTASLADWNMAVYETMQGPNEFTFTGNYRTWTRLTDLHRLQMPALVMCGQHDELTPACSTLMAKSLPNATARVFQNSSHMPFYEEPEAYFETLIGFLNKVDGHA